MASTPLTLAALATSAVPGLLVHGSRMHTNGENGGYTSVVVTTDDEELIVRVPRTGAAETRQSAELLGLAALTSGARSRLPFAVPEARGVTRAGETRAVVTTLVPGSRIASDSLESEALLLQPIADMLAAIHELPHGVAIQGGLTVRSAKDARLEVARFVERATSTRLLPETVHHRWQRALRQQELWDFAPAVIHGSLDLDQLLVSEDSISGVLGWSELSVGDPAVDLAWLLSSGDDVLGSVLARYSQLRDTGHRGHLRARAVLYHELEIARWLLHGVETHDQQVVDDAVAMLDRLVDRLLSSPEPRAEHRSLDERQVSQLLEEVPEVHDGLSDTAAYEALDEDRMFRMDTDVVAPLGPADVAAATPGNRDGSTAGGSSADAPVADMPVNGGASADVSPDDSGVQRTEPFDPLLGPDDGEFEAASFDDALFGTASPVTPTNGGRLNLPEDDASEQPVGSEERDSAVAGSPVDTDDQVEAERPVDADDQVDAASVGPAAEAYAGADDTGDDDPAGESGGESAPGALPHRGKGAMKSKGQGKKRRR